MPLRVSPFYYPPMLGSTGQYSFWPPSNPAMPTTASACPCSYCSVTHRPLHPNRGTLTRYALSGIVDSQLDTLGQVSQVAPAIQSSQAVCLDTKASVPSNGKVKTSQSGPSEPQGELPAESITIKHALASPLPDRPATAVKLPKPKFLAALDETAQQAWDEMLLTIPVLSENAAFAQVQRRGQILFQHPRRRSEPPKRPVLSQDASKKKKDGAEHQLKDGPTGNNLDRRHWHAKILREALKPLPPKVGDNARPAYVVKLPKSQPRRNLPVIDQPTVS